MNGLLLADQYVSVSIEKKEGSVIVNIGKDPN